jgi:23S rRNA (adenine-N6)-dimethyltransferase
MAQIMRHRVSRQWLHDNGVHPSALPRELTAIQWTALFGAVHPLSG